MVDERARERSPKDRHERTDFLPAVAIWFGIGMVALTGGGIFAAYLVFESLEGAAIERDEVRALRVGVSEPGQEERPPWPGDQLKVLRESEERALGEYEWVDREKGTVRIPIEEAMELIVERAARSGTGGAR